MARADFGEADILKVFPDLTERNIAAWTDNGLLTPVSGGSRFMRSSCRFSLDSVIMAGIIRELMVYGLSAGLIKGYFSNLWKNKMKELNYRCVFIWQRQTFHDPSEHELSSHFNARVWAIEDFNRYGVKTILEESTTDPRTDTLSPVGQAASMTSAIVVDVNRIVQMVKATL